MDVPSPSRRTERSPANHQKLERGEKRRAHSPSQGTNPADALTLDFGPPEQKGNTFLLSKPLVYCFAATEEMNTDFNHKKGIVSIP